MHRNDVPIAGACPPHVTAADFERRGKDQEFCRVCQKYVYDLSAMTAREAAAFMQLNADALPCIAYTSNERGNLLHVPATRLRRRSSTAALAVGATVFASACSTVEPPPNAGAAPIEEVTQATKSASQATASECTAPAIDSSEVSATSPSVRHPGLSRGVPAPPKHPNPSCNPPFWIDENGVRKPRLECL